MKFIVKYFFLADFYFWGVVLDLDKYFFLWQMCFFAGGGGGGGCVISVSFCIWVNTVCAHVS
jgi:hypothetical protein